MCKDGGNCTGFFSHRNDKKKNPKHQYMELQLHCFSGRCSSRICDQSRNDIPDPFTLSVFSAPISGRVTVSSYYSYEGCEDADRMTSQ